MAFSIQMYGQTYRTQALSDEIHTIQVNAGGDWQRLPIIQLDNNDYIQINFDRLGANSYKSLRYRLVNCYADWTRSTLLDVEYVDGFNNILIDDFAQSINTTIDYTNFNLEIPNDRQRIKLSGNYAVEVYEEDNPDKVLLTACFSILKPEVSITGSVSSNTDIDSNKEHQQVSFVINTSDLRIRDVFTDLKVFIRQNNRIDSQKSFVKPTYVQGNRLVYEFNKDLIFEAGNEYRRFESVSYRYNGLHIESTQYRRPYYYTFIAPDKIRAGKVYVYDKDQNGRFLIRNAEGQDSNTDADYFVTNFTLKADNPFLEPIYFNGAFTNDEFNEKTLMKYDYNKNEYHGEMLLKQGAYNYQYLAKSGKDFTASLIEGNYFQTQNQYYILVYHRPMGFQSDNLIATLLLTTGN